MLSKRSALFFLQVDALHEKHVSTAKEILSGPLLDEFLKGLNDDITSLKALLAAICIGARRRRERDPPPQNQKRPPSQQLNPFHYAPAPLLPPHARAHPTSH